MNTFTITYTTFWQLKDEPNYQVTKCGKMFNRKSGKQVKQVMQGGSIGYIINRKFVSLSKIRSSLIKIQTIKTPF
jgi:hypothetical protein